MLPKTNKQHEGAHPSSLVTFSRHMKRSLHLEAKSEWQPVLALAHFWALSWESSNGKHHSYTVCGFIFVLLLTAAFYKTMSHLWNLLLPWKHNLYHCLYLRTLTRDTSSESGLREIFVQISSCSFLSSEQTEGDMTITSPELVWNRRTTAITNTKRRKQCMSQSNTVGPGWPLPL